MPERTFSSPEYRYGFNGKEKDEEGEWGSLTHYDYGFRIYNPGIARFLSVDPLRMEYPWFTPYQFAGNTPIQAIDLDGLEPEYTPSKQEAYENTLTNQVFLGNGENKGTWVPIPNEKFLNDTEISVREGIDKARKKGATFAPNNLERWLEGVGGVVTFPVNKFLEVDQFVKDLDENTNRFFFTKNSQTGKTLWSIGMGLSDGQAVDYNDYFEINSTFPLITFNDEWKDLYYAWGTIKIVSEGTFTITNKDGVLSFNGEIVHKLSDAYNWNPGNETPIKGAGNIKDNQLLLLEIYRGAEPFKGEGEVIETIKVEYDLNKRQIIKDESSKKSG